MFLNTVDQRDGHTHVGEWFVICSEFLPLLRLRFVLFCSLTKMPCYLPGKHRERLGKYNLNYLRKVNQYIIYKWKS